MHQRDDLPPNSDRPSTMSPARDPIAKQATPPPAPSFEACCDRCGSVRLIRVKACWRCEACGYKSDCNGW